MAWLRVGLRRILMSVDEPPRLRAAWRLLAHFILFLLCIAVLGNALLLGLYLGLSEDSFFLLSNVIQLAAITLSVFAARRWLDRRSIASLGLRLDRWAGSDLLAGFVIAGIVMGLIFAAESALGWLEVTLPPPGDTAPGGQAGRLWVWLIAFVLVGWQEELLSRGYWLQNIADGTNLGWGVLFSSILFAALHGSNPHVTWVAIAGLVFAGLFLAYGYVTTRQLWLPIGLHIGWNIFEGNVFGFPVSGLENMPRLIHAKVSGPELITGGAFGPEAGLIVLPALAAGAGLIWLYSRYLRVPRRPYRR